MSTMQTVQLEDDAADYLDKVADSVRVRLVQDASVAAHRHRRSSSILAQKDIQAGISLRQRWDRKRIRVILARRLLILVGIVALMLATLAIGAISLTYFKEQAAVFVALVSALSLILTGILYSFIKTYFDGGAVLVNANVSQFIRSNKEERRLELIVQWDTLERRMRDEVEKMTPHSAADLDLGYILLYFADAHNLDPDDLRKALQIRNSVVHERRGLTIEQLNDALNYINSILQQLPSPARTTP